MVGKVVETLYVVLAMCCRLVDIEKYQNEDKRACKDLIKKTCIVIIFIHEFFDFSDEGNADCA